jgi:hypothetical protein
MAKPSLVAAFRAMLPPELREKARIDLPSAAELKAAIGNLAAKLRQQIRVKFQCFPCLLAVDGAGVCKIIFRMILSENHFWKIIRKK